MARKAVWEVISGKFHRMEQTGRVTYCAGSAKPGHNQPNDRFEAFPDEIPEPFRDQVRQVEGVLEPEVVLEQPQEGGEGTPQEGGEGTPQEGGEGTPQEGGEGTPQEGGEGTPQEGGEGTPQEGGEGTPQDHATN